jgi:uncharacterized membrane protein YhaH (DUF805 family)
MTFGSWFVRRGRISRRTFWLHYVLPLALLSLLAGFADVTVSYPGHAVGGYDPVYGYRTGTFGTLVALFSCIPSISSTVCRLHDRDHSAWWLCWGFLPVIGGVLLFVTTGFLSGTGFPNRYGAPADGEPGYLPSAC